jgi:hypothetical protein
MSQPCRPVLALSVSESQPAASRCTDRATAALKVLIDFIRAVFIGRKTYSPLVFVAAVYTGGQVLRSEGSPSPGSKGDVSEVPTGSCSYATENSAELSLGRSDALTSHICLRNFVAHDSTQTATDITL